MPPKHSRMRATTSTYLLPILYGLTVTLLVDVFFCAGEITFNTADSDHLAAWKCQFLSNESYSGSFRQKNGISRSGKTVD